MSVPPLLELTCSSRQLAGVCRDFMRFAYGRHGWTGCQSVRSLAAFLDLSRRRTKALASFLQTIGLMIRTNGKLIWPAVSTFKLTIKFDR